MIRDFDYHVGGIEDGIVALIASTLKVVVTGGYVKTIASYSGELDSDQVKKALDDLLPILPAILVSYAGGDDDLNPATAPVMGEPQIYLHKCTFSIMCCSDDARGEHARRRGAADGTGVYRMLADVRRLLAGYKFQQTEGAEKILLNTEPLKLSGVQFIARLPQLTAYVAHVDTSFRFMTIDRRAPGQPIDQLIFDLQPTSDREDTRNLPGVFLQ